MIDQGFRVPPIDAAVKGEPREDVAADGSALLERHQPARRPPGPRQRVLLERHQPARRRKRNRLRQQRPPRQPAQPAQPGAEPRDEAGNCSLTTKTSSLAHT